ncbi:hypothetical protein EGW08_016722, partial [Elysia chlorotica]
MSYGSSSPCLIPPVDKCNLHTMEPPSQHTSGTCSLSLETSSTSPLSSPPTPPTASKTTLTSSPLPFSPPTPPQTKGKRTGVNPSRGVIALSLIKLSLWAEILLLGGVGSEDASAGFSATKVPGLNLISVQCNGSHLPPNARSIQNMVLFHYPAQAGGHPYTIASLSSV